MDKVGENSKRSSYISCLYWSRCNPVQGEHVSRHPVGSTEREKRRKQIVNLSVADGTQTLN